MSLAADSQRSGRWHWLPILLLVLLNLVIGLFVVADYGISADEPSINIYSAQTLEDYSQVIRGQPRKDHGIMDYYGPAFFASTELAVLFFKHVMPWVSQVDVRHYSYFVAFQVAIVSLYVLCRRWMRDWAAFGTALLFSTQPLFWGHAFINPKDIPFMAFFLASVAAGFAMVDRVSRITPYAGYAEAGSYHGSELRGEWERAPVGLRRLLGVLVVVWGAFVVLVVTRVPEGVTSGVVRAMYRADRSSWIARVFGLLAQNAGTLTAASYVHKAVRLVEWVEVGVICLGVIAIVVVAGSVFPGAKKWMWGSVLKPLGRQVVRVVREPLMILAGVLLGLTTSIRILGPYAGVLVGLYALYRSPKRTVGMLAPYGVVAGVVSYLSWPYLWGHPLGSILGTIRVLSAFPYGQAVLFQGKLIPGSELPATFLPTVMGLQLTETALLLFVGGVVLAVWKMVREKVREPLGLLILWLLVPLGGIILSGSTVYDNFRQLFFLIPPVFICAGLGLDWVLGKVRTIALAVLTLAVVVAPGIYSIITLHPYEYVYYNQLVGGVRGAFRSYELDYWYTSFRDAAGILNRTAPPNAGVMAIGSAQSLRQFIRPDIEVFRAKDIRAAAVNQRPKYEYVVITGRNNSDLSQCKDARVVGSVERVGAMLSVIKKVGPGEAGCP